MNHDHLWGHRRPADHVFDFGMTMLGIFEVSRLLLVSFSGLCESPSVNAMLDYK